MTNDLQAKNRLLARILFADEVTPIIKQKRDQIKNLQKTLPSEHNKMEVSDQQKINTEKQVLNLKNQVLDERAKQARKDTK
jgi:hypothetical protein